MKKTIICVLVFFCLIIVCNFLRKERIPKIEFVFPNSMSAIYNGRDTTVAFPKGKAKFIVLYDSTLCTSCQVSNLYIWRSFIELNDSNFQTYIIFSPDETDLPIVKNDLLEMNYDFCVYIDSAFSFMRMNSNYNWNKINNHFFLLNKQQKVELLGFPFLEKEKEDEYIKTIEKLKQKNGY